MKLRLLLFPDCNRRCIGCCNKDWNLEALPVCNDYTGYELIMLTGGEPLINPTLVLDTVKRIRQETTTPIYVYTAKTTTPTNLLNVLSEVDGITLTLHEQYDVPSFHRFCELLNSSKIVGKSLRLNIFDGIEISDIPPSWVVKKGIKWIKDCPLPTDEKFMRLN